MAQRLNIQKVAPAAYQAMLTFTSFLATTRITPVQAELIKIRASQINGCAFCINMHTAEARKQGETEQRIYLLNAWRETDLFSDEEKAILALTESVTLVHQHVSEEVYATVARYFDEEFISQLIMAIVIINGWNRIVIASGTRVG